MFNQQKTDLASPVLLTLAEEGRERAAISFQSTRAPRARLP